MRRVHRIEDSDISAHDVDISPNDLGAESCIVMPEINDGTLTVGHSGIGDLGINPMYVIAQGQVGAINHRPFGFNVYPTTIRFAFGAATNRRVHLDFFDEAITPFGFQCALASFINVANGADEEAFAGLQFRGYREILILVSSTQSGNYRLTLQYGTRTVAMVYEVSESAVLPTVQAMQWIPNPDNIQMQVFNTDAGTADFEFQVWGRL